MKKRAICFLLSAVILLSLIVPAVPEAAAAYDMKASDALIELVKDFEGFSVKPYLDNGQWSVGYGTAVSGKDLAKYQASGITDKEAEALLKKFIAEFEEDVNTFAKKFSLKLKQQQFDALISFTYNLGPNWMNNDSIFRQAVIKGQKGNDFIFAITRWCTADDVVLEMLAKRRLAEANLYLNGVYSDKVPENYQYVIFNNNIEAPVTNAVKIQGFDTVETQAIASTPSKTGYKFLGWYTKAVGGEWINALNAAVDVRNLYAHWQKGDGETDSKGNVLGVAAKYQRIVTVSSSKTVRSKPVDTASKVKTLKTGDKVTVIADYLDAKGAKWGKLSSGGWLNLTGIGAEDVTELTPIEPTTVTVIANDVNIRCGAGTNYYKTGKFAKNEKIVITAVQKSGQYLWGKCVKGWVCLHYTDYDLIMAAKSEDGSKVTATGVISGTTRLNIRNGPGTSYEVVGQYSKGDPVQITLQQDVGSTTWGLTQKGWVSLYYVDLAPAADTTNPEQKPPEDEQKPDEDQKGEEEEKPDNGIIGTGKVYNCTGLYVRSAPGTSSKRVGRLERGTKVEILECRYVKSEAWGKIDKGWICLTFVKLEEPIDPEDVTTETEPKPTEKPDSTPTEVKATGTVVKCTSLRVRSKAGVDNPQVGSLPKGTRINIYETTKVRTSTWARCDQGWVHMYYIELDAGSTAPKPTDPAKPESGQKPGDNPVPDTGSGETKIGTIVKTNKLRIRGAAGVDSPEVGSLSKGDTVLILETTKVGSSTWGRIDKGWISMYYVKLQSGSAPAGAFVGTISTNGLNIRAAAGTDNASVGKYNKGDQVVILETTMVGSTTWGKTSKGWISLYYVD